jgi:hypothetical protein
MLIHVTESLAAHLDIFELWTARRAEKRSASTQDAPHAATFKLIYVILDKTRIPSPDSKDLSTFLDRRARYRANAGIKTRPIPTTGQNSYPIHANLLGFAQATYEQRGNGNPHHPYR